MVSIHNRYNAERSYHVERMYILLFLKWTRMQNEKWTIFLLKMKMTNGLDQCHPKLLSQKRRKVKLLDSTAARIVTMTNNASLALLVSDNQCYLEI